MAKLSRAALGTAAGRLYAKQGWGISTTGARPAGGGAYERMGGLDGFYANQDAMNAGDLPGQRSDYTSPFMGLPGVNSPQDAAFMSRQTMGGRSMWDPNRGYGAVSARYFRGGGGGGGGGVRRMIPWGPGDGTSGMSPMKGVPSAAATGYAAALTPQEYQDLYGPEEMEFDSTAYQNAIATQNRMASGGATFTGVPDPQQFVKPKAKSLFAQAVGRTAPSLLNRSF